MFGLIIAMVLQTVLAPVQPALSVMVSGDRAQVQEIWSIRDQGAAQHDWSVRAPVRLRPERLGVVTDAPAVAVMDMASGMEMFAKNADDPLPIASITKLVTALTVIELGVDWGKEVRILGSDMRSGGVPYVIPGEIVTVRDLFDVSLIASGNGATVALARSTGLEQEEFVEAMNQMAFGLRMRDSSFVEPTGLDPGNVASARDVMKLLRHALGYPEIADALTRSRHSFRAVSGLDHLVESTDALLGSFLDDEPYEFFGGKTGYIYEAGYCFVAAAGKHGSGRVIAVVLGASSKEARFREVKRLIWWALDAFEWPEEPTKGV